eukprot:TRINITY_DN803_c0_g1_i3.p1 TRINITY_DN803_c0_g1~~TRINITY_DN803_c0_g1_i3.p1  ORF type:complete len:600 (+),score=184.35 TRINITY_DN803_c0_g1_i3:139-1800(+)
MGFRAIEHDLYDFMLPVDVFAHVCGYLEFSSLPMLRTVCAPIYLGVRQYLEENQHVSAQVEKLLSDKFLSLTDQGKKVSVSIRLKPVSAPWCVKVDRKKISSASSDAHYMFDNVFDITATQEQVFSRISRELFFSIARQENVCVFAYGQTGAGKTHTMFGNVTSNDRESEGVAFRVINGIAKDSPFWSTEVTAMEMSFLEVYNEKVHDLLATGDGTTTDLKPSQDKDGKFYIQGMTVVSPRTPAEWRKWMSLGSQHRAAGRTVFNERSSRSHAIVTVHMVWRNGKRSKLHLVDLAGSERAGKHALNEKSLTEGTFINKSLSTLARVVSAVASGQGDHVPIRDSILTQLLADSIAGQDNSKSFMFAAVNPSDAAKKETSSTLEYATQYSTLRSPLPRQIQLASEELRAKKRQVELLQAAFVKRLSELKIDEKRLELLLKERRVRIKHKANEVQGALAAMGVGWSGFYNKKLASSGRVLSSWKVGNATTAHMVLFEDGRTKWYPVPCVVEERTFTLLRTQRDELRKKEVGVSKQADALKALKHKYAKLQESWQKE